MRLAIFDIDGTLVHGGSERMFWRYLYGHDRQSFRQYLAYAIYLLRYLPVGGIHTNKKDKAYLTGLDVADVERLAAEFVDTELAATLYEPAVTRVKQHVKSGDLVLLMSGTLQPIAEALGRRLGVEHVCATLCSESRGKFRSRPPERHPFKSAKLLFAREFAAQHALELDAAAAYGDSCDDIELLEAVGFPVAVRPDRELLATAMKRGWEVLSPDSAAAATSVVLSKTN
jgi:HAD superfamily hydrolase (TIGR01490 family)